MEALDGALSGTLDGSFRKKCASRSNVTVCSSIIQIALASAASWAPLPKSDVRVVGPLHGGETNTSYLLSDGYSQFVLRVHSLQSHQMGIRRETEHLILRRLHPLGISPVPIYWDSKQRFSVLSYIPGKVWTDRELKNKSQRRKLFSLIDCYQELPIELDSFDYSQHLLRYWQMLPRGRCPLHLSSRQWLRLKAALKVKLAQKPPLALSHHDLRPANIVENDDGISILDWEYAGLGWRDMDRNYVYYQTGTQLTRRAAFNTRCTIFYRDLFYWLDEMWRVINARHRRSDRI